MDTQWLLLVTEVIVDLAVLTENTALPSALIISPILSLPFGQDLVCS